MEIDPQEEVLYRLRLAEEHLQTAEKRYTIEDWAGVVQSSQLAAENAAKAVISHYHIPSWTHDPSGELEQITSQLPPNTRNHAHRLAEIVRELAPEHGRTSYGLPAQRITPAQLYSRDAAEQALHAAREAINIAKHILTRLGYHT